MSVWKLWFYKFVLQTVTTPSNHIKYKLKKLYSLLLNLIYLLLYIVEHFV